MQVARESCNNTVSECGAPRHAHSQGGRVQGIMSTSSVGNLVSLLAASVHAHGERPLFGTRGDAGWGWMSYGDFARRVDALRAGLAGLGVAPGDRVAVISRNRVEWAVGCYATAGLGAAYVPMYEGQTERDWTHILSDSGARVCLVSGGAVGPRVAAVARGIPTLAHVVDFDAPADDPRGYAGLLAAGERSPVAPVALAGSEMAELCYTSGTTGRPKGVRLTHASIVSNVEAVTRLLPLSHADRSLAFLPWAHVFGGDELHGMILLGASVAICEDVDRLVGELKEVKPTLLFAVPRVWNRVFQNVRHGLTEQPRLVQALFQRATRARHRRRAGEALPAGDALALALANRLVFPKIRQRFGGRLRYAFSAAAALSPEVAEFIDDLGIVVLEAYGLTETSACATINRPEDRRIGSVGKPIPGVRVELDTKAPGAEGGEGEIVVYGHCVMAGYHNLPAETATTLTADGGLRTGDLGRFDSDGFLYVTGRIKEIYKLENGKYVAPAALEEQLTLSPLIEQAFVYGANRPHNVALLVPNREALLAWARARGKDATPFGELLSDADVRAVFEGVVVAAGEGFRGYERIGRFALIEDGFSTTNGLLTPTLKVKRSEVLKRYQGSLETLFAAREPDRRREDGEVAHHA